MHGRSVRNTLLVLVWLALAAGATGCLMPNRGTPVWVDTYTGKWWSGKGALLETTDDGRCYIAARNRALVVEKRWVDCRHVHPRRTGRVPSPR